MNYGISCPECKESSNWDSMYGYCYRCKFSAITPRIDSVSGAYFIVGALLVALGALTYVAVMAWGAQ